MNSQSYKFQTMRRMESLKQDLTPLQKIYMWTRIGKLFKIVDLCITNGNGCPLLKNEFFLIAQTIEYKTNWVVIQTMSLLSFRGFFKLDHLLGLFYLLFFLNARLYMCFFWQQSGNISTSPAPLWSCFESSHLPLRFCDPFFLYTSHDFWHLIGSND